VCHHAQHPDRSELGGKGERVGPDDAREFVASNHRAVPITRRSGGELQTSPVLVRVDPSPCTILPARAGRFLVLACDGG
jgi:hypothetical protein